MWAGYIWLKTGSNFGLLWRGNGNKTAGSMKGSTFLH